VGLFSSRCVTAQGIEAEILFCGEAAKKIAADSPVFCGVPRRKKCAQILLPKNSSSLISHS
jgi:hypothetical protein